MDKYRQYFPITKNKVYLNHAATAPISTKVKAAIEDFYQVRSAEKPGNWSSVVQTANEVKSMFAKLINAVSAERIAFTQNTTHGLNIIASGLKWRPGDQILLPNNEFPANVYPFKNLERYGVELKYLPTPQGGITPEILKSHISQHTKMLTLSFVEFLSGYKHDLAKIGAICKENDIIFVVDSIQGVGAIPLDVQKCHIDGLANGGHKWLMSPQGTGYLYITESLQSKIQQSHLGWTGLKNMDDFLNYERQPLESASRYELGTLNFAGILGSHAALSLLLKVGVEKIYEHLINLTDYGIEKLTDLDYKIYTNSDPAYRSGILSFYPKIEGTEFFKILRKNNIICSPRQGKIRIAPHFYNNKSDIDKLIDICKKY